MSAFDRRAIDLGRGSWIQFGFIAGVLPAAGMTIPEGTLPEDIPLAFLILSTGQTMPVYESQALEDIDKMRKSPFGGGFGG